MTPIWAVLKIVGGGIGRIIKAIPGPVWIALGVIALLHRGIVWHQGAVHDAVTAAYDKGQDDAAATFAAAQREADELQRQETNRIEAEQRASSRSAENALLDAYEDIDRRAARIRVQRHAATHPAGSEGGATGATEAGTPATSSCPATGVDGLPWSVVEPLLIRAERNQAQLFAILDWEAEQQRIAGEAASRAEAIASSPDGE